MLHRHRLSSAQLPCQRSTWLRRSARLGCCRRTAQVFPPDTTQEKLYGSAISSIVEEVLEGFNCTIFAYGQTGTGKVCGAGVAGGDGGAAVACGTAGHN